MASNVISTVVWLMVSGVLDFLCGKIEVKPKKTAKRIAFIFSAISFGFAIIEGAGINIVSFLLDCMQKYLLAVYIYILLIAVLAPALAFFDGRKSSKAVRPGYVWKNLGFNILGACSACSMLFIARKEITDFRFIEEFYVKEIIVMLVPLCLCIAFSYQTAEQQMKKKEMDHSASLKWKNQICNIMHLINTYFFSLASAVFVVAYTLYCYVHHTKTYLNEGYLVLLSITLFFFYICGLHKNKQAYLIFIVCVPAILVSGTYWMSWFVINRKMMKLQMVFIVLQTLIYALIIYRREGIIKVSKVKNRRRSGNKVRCGYVYNVTWLHVAILVAVVACYMVLWIVPLSVERITYNNAVKYIDALCSHTDKDADRLLDEMMGKEWWNEDDKDADYAQYLAFVYDVCQEELIKKGVITEKEQQLSYEKLDDWYKQLPRGY